MSKLILNTQMQEMPLGKGEGTVMYDPDTENTHILDDVALDIINLFREAASAEEVIEKLLEIYDASREKLEKDVLEFVKEAEANRILLPYESADI